MMIFGEKYLWAENFGKKIGFVSGYAIFTALMFLALKFSGRLPKTLPYLTVAAISLFIAAIGFLVRRFLK